MKTNHAAKATMKKAVVKAAALGVFGLAAINVATPARADWVENEYGGYADDYYSEPTDGSKSMNQLLREMREMREAEKGQYVSPEAQAERQMVNSYIYGWHFGYTPGYSAPSSSSMTSPYYNSGGW